MADQSFPNRLEVTGNERLTRLSIFWNIRNLCGIVPSQRHQSQ